MVEDAGTLGKRRMQVEAPVRVQGLTILTLTELSISKTTRSRGAFIYASRQPVAIIVAGEAGARAFRTSGEEMPLDRLLAEAPEAREEIMAAIAAAR